MEQNNIKLPGYEKLAKLQYFTPNVFILNNKKEQEVCNFILMLSLIYNDFKDLLWAYFYMEKCKLPTISHPTSYSGQYGGINWHITRLFHSLIFEFTKLIKENSTVLDHPLFIKTIQQIHKENKNNWNWLVSFAKGENIDENDKKLHEISRLIRNTIAFHYYQPKFLYSGYECFFLKKDNPTNQNAFISNGVSLETTRFYFADAAVEGCFQRIISKEDVKILNRTLKDITEKIGKTLHNIIISFIQLRLIELKDGYHDYIGDVK
jgi:hypothetical protein